MYENEPDWGDVPLPDEPSAWGEAPIPDSAEWDDIPLPDEPYDPEVGYSENVPPEDYEAYLNSFSEEAWIASDGSLGQEFGGANAGVFSVEGLNPEQAAAVNSLTGTTQVVAGPGSGKTRVITERIKHLLHNGADPRRVLAVTFTKKAANEMKERMGLNSYMANRMWVTTFHGMCVRILKQEHERFGLPREFTILDSGDTKSYLKAVYKEAELPWDGEVASLISVMKNEYFYDYAQAGTDERTLAVKDFMSIWNAYEARKTENEVVDFDDLQILIVNALSNDKEFAERWGTWFQHVSVDEYQDTNPVQERLVRLLAQGAESLFIVGDADQSIYKFRGAVPGVMEEFYNQDPSINQIVLQDNYRSTPDILNVVKAVIQPNPSDSRSNYVANRPRGQKPVIMSHIDGRAEKTYVSRQIRKMIDNGTLGSEIAVLAGVNAVISEYEQEMLVLGIPYQISGKQKLLDRKLVKDALAFFRVAVRPNDVEAIVRSAVLMPGLGDKRVRDWVKAAKAEGVSILPYLRELVDTQMSRKKPPKWAESLGEYLTTVDKVREDMAATGNDFRQVFDGLKVLFTNLGEEDLGLLDSVVNLSEGFCAREEMLRLHRDFTYAIEHPDHREAGTLQWDEGRKKWVIQFAAAVPEGTLFSEETIKTIEVAPDSVGKYCTINNNVSLASRFVDWCTLDASEEGDIEDKVVLSTVHSAKGREFEAVFVVGAEEGYLPRNMEGADAEEERRLMFVALSRAKSRLEVHWAEGRAVWGSFQSRRPSHYLDDFSHVCEVKGAALNGVQKDIASQEFRW